MFKIEFLIEKYPKQTSMSQGDFSREHYQTF